MLCGFCDVLVSFIDSHYAAVLISKSMLVFTVADYGNRLTEDKYVLDVTQHISAPARPHHRPADHVSVGSFTSPGSLDIIATGGSYSGTMEMNRTGRCHADENLRSFSFSMGSEPPPKRQDVDYYGSVSTYSRSDSALPLSCRPSLSEPRGSFCSSFTPLAGVSRDRSDLRRTEATSFEGFTTDHCGSVLSVPRSRSHSPVSTYCGEPPSSVPGDISRGRMLRSPDHRCRVLSAHGTQSRSPASRYGELDSSSLMAAPSSDDGRYIGSCSGVVDQSCSSRKRQHQQPVGSSSSLLFAKKLAKLQAIR